MGTPKITPVRWLLEFVNLPFKQGIPGVFRPIVKPLKRTPTKEPETPKPLSAETIKGLRDYYKKEGFTRKAITERISEAKRSQSVVDHKGYSWEIKNGKTVFAGHGACYPTREEINSFLKKYKFPLIGDVNNDFGFPSCKEFDLWNKVFHIFSYMARVSMGIKPGEYEGSLNFACDFCREHVKSNRHSPRDTGHVIFFDNFYDTVIACIYAFWERQKDLHSRLKQCLCCGRFWVEEVRIGRQKKFCGDTCRKRFDDQARDVNKIASEISKKHKRKTDKSKIMSVLKRKHGDDAGVVYKNTVEGKINTYKDFVRRRGRHYSLKPQKPSGKFKIHE